MSAERLFWQGLLYIAIVGTASSTIYLIMVLVGAFRFHREAKSARKRVLSLQSALPPVTIFKPVHGMELRLEENLDSFFQQDYPNFEIVIGARDAENAALRVAQTVAKKYPHVPSRIIISGPPTWPNAKVFSLSKMIPTSSNDFFVISDSDVKVGRDFLRNIVPPLLDPAIGLVTCLYKGVPAGDFWSLLEALGMSVEMPSGVVVADMIEGIRFALGPAVAIRREGLDKIGGIAATADYYSDDYVLGNKMWLAGYKVIFSHYFIEHVLTPRSLIRTLGDQLRWMKSTRYSRPLGHVGTGLTYAMPFGILGIIAALVLGRPFLGAVLICLALGNRFIQSIVVGWRLIGDSRSLYFSWLYPLRDLQGWLMWACSFTGRNFLWRGEKYRFTKNGRIVASDRNDRNDRNDGNDREVANHESA
ncbi:MAG: glycosyltransferase [Terriglobales bacterium]